MKLRIVAKQGALDALAASRPGVRPGGVDPELADARAEVARLFEALKEMGVRLMLAEGMGVGTEWPGPAPRRRGHQSWAAAPDRRGDRGPEATVTLALPKVGLRGRPEGTGDLYLADISVPAAAYERLAIRHRSPFSAAQVVRLDDVPVRGVHERMPAG
jgi:hypothetical protein